MVDTLRSEPRSHALYSVPSAQGQMGRRIQELYGGIDGLRKFQPEGVSHQVEKLRPFRRIQQLLQLGVTLESGRCVGYGRHGVVDIDYARGAVTDAATQLGLPFTLERQEPDRTLWLVPGTGYGVRYMSSIVSDRSNHVEVVVPLHGARTKDSSALGALQLGDLKTLMCYGNGISAHSSSFLTFTANTRDRENALISARCEISTGDKTGLELRIKIPVSRMK